MKLRCLRVPAFLILAFSLPASAQSLGDVARQLRTERQQSGATSPKVITNDDIQPREPASASRKKTSKNASEEEAKSATDEAAQEESGKEAGKEAEEAGQAASPAGEAKSTKGKKDTAKEREEQELALEKQTEEINKSYLERIAAIRAKISAAQQELTQLQLDQVESTNAFRRSVGTSPNVGTYEAEQRLFSEQIASHRELINSLNAQLEDAQEAARHAGVPHASE